MKSLSGNYKNSGNYCSENGEPSPIKKLCTEAHGFRALGWGIVGNATDQ